MRKSENATQTKSLSGPLVEVATSPADEVCAETLRVANRIEETAQRLATRLRPVTFEENPTISEVGGPARTYPPLFEAIRRDMYRIDDAIDYINSVIDRLGV